MHEELLRHLRESGRLGLLVGEVEGVDVVLKAVVVSLGGLQPVLDELAQVEDVILLEFLVEECHQVLEGVSIGLD